MLRRLALMLTFALGPAVAQDGAPTRLLGAKLAGLEAVGRVNVQGAGFCTGVLVAPDLVLTAAHCLYHSRSQRRVSDDRVHFVAAWRKGAYAAHGRVVRSVLPEAYRYTPTPVSTVLAADIALLRLEAPLQITPMPLADLSDAPFAVVSYGRGRAHVPTLQDPCRRHAAPGPVLRLTCDIAPGSSGAPVLQRASEGYGVVAVISALAKTPDGAWALAAPLSDHVDKMRARLETPQAR